MTSDRIELRDGIIAYLDEGEVYSCNVHWLGREIKIRLYSSEDTVEAVIETIKKAFDSFWDNRDNYLKMFQSDIIDTLLPFFSENKSPDKYLPYPNITEDDFYADYWLSEVYIGTGDLGNDMQVTFSSENGEDMLCVHRDLDNGTILDFFDGGNVIYPDAMGL